MPPQHGSDDVFGSAYQAARQLGWRILDRNSMARRLWWHAYKQPHPVGKDAIMVDPVHYLPYVNDEFNNVLLNVLFEGK